MWTVHTLSAVVDAELAALPRDLLARFSRFADFIETAGLENLPPHAVKHLEGKLWELRLSAPSGIARAIYVTVVQRRVVVLRVFVKKTQKTPRRELDIARQREREIR
jgi:phage-related protein